jgi:hypothetical protein
MYAAFRENNESLPGDEEILKKPSVKIYLYPLPEHPPESSLPRLVSSQLIVQRNMTICALKKYLVKKFEDLVSDPETIIIYFKNMKMRNEFSFKDVDRLYKFQDDKVVFFYSKI